jgi:signal transduction histidine kinase
MTTATGNPRPKQAECTDRGLWGMPLVRIVLPSVLGVALLSAAIFLIILPALEAGLMEEKKAVSRSLVQAVCAQLSWYEHLAQSGALSRAEAQDQAIGLIRHLRYGGDGKNYFWITNTDALMLMHPYRPDLEGADVAEFRDAKGKYVFRECIRAVRDGGGNVNYFWQWKDDPRHVAPKFSYVQAFEPWGWIVGTGNYVEDVTAQIQAASRRLAWAAGAVLAVVTVLSGITAWNGCRSERRRRDAEAGVKRLNEQLELRVRERTAELAQTTRELQAEIDERNKAETRQGELQSQLMQAQRLESVGRLAAGIAHEINTPVQFVSDNTRFFRSAFPKLAELLTRHQQLAAACRAGPVATNLLDDLEAAAQAAKLDYLLQEIPQALSDSLEGLERVTKIVRAMKDFAHPGQQSRSPADLNRAIESTVTVARNEWKYVAELQLDLDPALPPVPCLLGDFNQVILNLVVNSAYAIKAALKDGNPSKGTITITTRQDQDRVEVRVADTGTGIRPEHRDKVFDHFFTTKEVGQGTGQGLAIARRIIVEKHGGTLKFETQVGRGTTFVIRLPVNPPASAGTEASERELAHSTG